MLIQIAQCKWQRHAHLCPQLQKCYVTTRERPAPRATEHVPAAAEIDLKKNMFSHILIKCVLEYFFWEVKSHSFVSEQWKRVQTSIPGPKTDSWCPLRDLISPRSISYPETAIMSGLLPLFFEMVLALSLEVKYFLLALACQEGARTKLLVQLKCPVSLLLLIAVRLTKEILKNMKLLIWRRQ